MNMIQKKVRIKSVMSVIRNGCFIKLKKEIITLL